MRLLNALTAWWRRTQTPKGRHARPRRVDRMPARIPPTAAAIALTRAQLREPERIDPALFRRRHLVHPAYTDWEQRQQHAPLRYGDGLDDVRAALGPLVHQLLAQERPVREFAGAGR